MSFKKVKVVILPTNEKSKLVLSYSNELAINWTHDLAKFDDATYQNLYFLSDEEIKEGDWILHKNTIYQVRINKGLYLTLERLEHIDVRSDLCKKIIATTDNSLEKICEYESGTWLRLPQPSTSFIEKFVEEYNKGNVITEVMVEYNLMNKGYDKPEDYPYQECEILKVNPKDNTITIRKVKDSWNKEEFMKFGNWCRIHDSKFPNQVWTIQQLFDKWIEENL